MYVYFDRNGTIKEVINDLAIRRGSVEANKIYVYVEDTEIDDIWFVARKPDGTLTTEQSFITNTVEKAIPYDAKRDMYYFKDFETYKFYVYTLTSSELSEAGLMIATIRIVQDNTIFALGELTFNVQQNVIKDDNNITQSQYDYLLLSFSSLNTLVHTFDDRLEYLETNTYTKTEVNNLLDDKADRDNVNQTIKANVVEAQTICGKTRVVANAFIPFNTYGIYTIGENFNGYKDETQSYMKKDLTLERVTDSEASEYYWTTLVTVPSLTFFDDIANSKGNNNRTGLGVGLNGYNSTNYGKADIQLIPAFRYAQDYTEYALHPLDALVMFRPYFLFSPLGRIYDMDKAPYVYFGYNTDPYDNTKKSIHLQAHSTSFDVNTKGVELNGTGLHFYENGNQLAYKSAVDSAQSEIDAIKDGTTIDSFADVEDALSGVDDDVSALETKVNNLSSVQNVVDVVATKSALDNLSTTNLEQYDKVQVIADETHNGSSTIYEWTGSAWSYVGAYGGNAYTKAQVDALLLEKQDVIDTSNKLNSAYINDTNVITISKTISESFNEFIDVNITQSGYISQLDFNKIDKNTKFEWTIYSSADNTSIQVTARLLTGSVVVDSNNATTISYTFVGNAVFEGDSTKDISLACTINVDDDREYQASLRSIIQYNANGVDGMFLTDAEMTALLSEVFN